MKLKQTLLRLSVLIVFITSLVGLSVFSYSSAQSVDCTSLPYTTLTKSMPADAPYSIWVLAKKESASAKPYVQANDGECHELALPSGADWEWVRGVDGTINENLNAGDNTFKLSVNGGAVLLDKVVVTNDLDCTPTGDGGNCIEAPLDFAVNGIQANEVVSGSKTISAQLINSLEGVTVEFLIDGTRLISRQTEAPYCMARINNECRGYNMDDLGEGAHTLNVRGRTEAGQHTDRNIPFVVAEKPIPVPEPEEPPEEPTPEEPQNPEQPPVPENVSVKVVGVKSNDTLSGPRTISAEVSGTTKQTSVTFKIDNRHISFRIAKPYCMVLNDDGSCGGWDSATLPNGNYTLHVVTSVAGASDIWTSVPIKIENKTNQAPPAPQPTKPPQKEIIIGNGKQKASGWVKLLISKSRLKEGTTLTLKVDDKVVYSKPAIAGDSTVINTANFSNGDKTLSAVITSPGGAENVVASEVAFENNFFTQAAAWMQNNRTETLVGGVILSVLLFGGSYIAIQRYRHRQAIKRLTPHGVGNNEDEEIEIMDHKIAVSKPVKGALHAAHGFAVIAVVLLSGFAVYRLGSSALAAGLGFVAEVEDGIVTDSSGDAFHQDMDHAQNRIYMRINYGGSAPEEPEEPEHPHEPEESTEPEQPQTGNPSTSCTPGTMAVYGPCVNGNTIPGPWAGFPAGAGNVTRPVVHAPRTNSYDSFRHRCEYSHMNFDDPILYPGQQNRAHLHTFFGNSATDYRSTSSSLLNSGGSTCSGGTMNRSAYWMPSMIDASTGTPITPLDDRSGYNSDLEIYYKLGYQGATPETIQPIPNGLHIIAGNAANTTSLSQIPTENAGYWLGEFGRHYTTIYHCETDNPGFPGTHTTAELPYIPPNCNRGQYLQMSIMLPGCWDGRNLTSANGRSHMTYGRWGQGCPSSHPVVIPMIEMFVIYKVTTANTANWKLSSDNYTGGPGAGLSGHADYMFAWSPTAFPTVVNQCHRRLLDCHYALAPLGYPGNWDLTEARQYRPRVGSYIH